MEVQTALDKLSASLKSSSTSISEERRNSLLQLVSRLQQGLTCQLTPSSSSERRASFQGSRFTKKKPSRHSRHTVGVTSEELEDARRLMEEIGLNNENIFSNETILKTQNSDGVALNKIKVKNLTAKPFISSNTTSQSQSGTSSTVETPTETSESIDFLASSNSDILDNEKPNRTYNQSLSMDNQPQGKLLKRRPLSDANSLDFSSEIDVISIQNAVKTAASNKLINQSKNIESDTDDDSSTIKNSDKQPKPDLIMQANPVYRHGNEESDDEFNNNQYNEKANRFNTKKLKMKRANTIDIPKPLKYYECDDDESENEDTTRRNSYLALRGPIHVGKFNIAKKVPQFEAKTENDKKFLAFINKQNADKSETVATPPKTPWIKQTNTIWNNANSIGKIRNAFEKQSSQNSTTNINSARNFWKSADDAITAGKQKNFGPKISRQSARNLQQMFEEKQKQSQREKENWSKNIVTGSLKVDTKSLEANNVKVITQPNPINKFTHNPMMSAFKPVKPQQKQPKQQKGEERVYLYSPKPCSPQNVPSSPISTTPWLPKSSESRVLSIAASKFENPPKDNVSERKTKITIPPGLKNQESLASPHIIKSLNQNSSVRKLSGQYDSLMNQNINTNFQNNTRMYVPGENYTIQYQQNQPKIKPSVYNAEYTITQKIHYPPVISEETQHNLKQLNYNQQLQETEIQTPEQPDFVKDTKGYSKETDDDHYYHSPAEIRDCKDGNYQKYRDSRKGNRDYDYYPKGGDYQTYLKENIFPRNNYKEIPQEGYEKLHQDVNSQESQNYSNYQNIEQNYQKYNKKSSNETYPEYGNHPKEDIYGNYQNIKAYQGYQHVEGNHKKKDKLEPQNENYYYQKEDQEEDGYLLNERLNYGKYQKDNYQTVGDHKDYQQTEDAVHSGKTHQNYREDDQNNYHASVYQHQNIFQQNVPPNQQSYQTYVSVKSDQNQDKNDNKEADIQFTSNYEFTPKIIESNQKSRSPKISYDRQVSDESIHEHTAVGSRVMTGPVGQVITVQNNTPRTREEHDLNQAFNLKSTLQKLSQNQSEPKNVVLYNNVTPSNKKPMVCLNDKPMESLEINEDGESVLTSKFHIQVKPDLNHQALSKSESWHQICQGKEVVANKPSPRASPNSRMVTRSKSSHTLAVPKQYEAGMSKQEMAEKQKSLQAYFGSKAQLKETTKKSSINRVKTSQKISTQRQNSNSALSRSQTLPDVICLDRLDDDNIDEVFEEIFKSST